MHRMREGRVSEIRMGAIDEIANRPGLSVLIDGVNGGIERGSVEERADWPDHKAQEIRPTGFGKSRSEPTSFAEGGQRDTKEKVGSSLREFIGLPGMVTMGVGNAEGRRGLVGVSATADKTADHHLGSVCPGGLTQILQHPEVVGIYSPVSVAGGSNSFRLGAPGRGGENHGQTMSATDPEILAVKRG